MISPFSLQAGTAVSGQTVIGKSAPFCIFLESINKPITIAPIVVKNLSHDLNLGEAFLQGEKAELKFNHGTGSLKIDKCQVNIVDKNAHLMRNSDDKRFADVMLADKAERNRINNCHEYMNISESAFSTKTVDKGTICKNSIGFIKVKTNISNSSGYFATKENSNFQNSNNLVTLSGIFTIKEGYYIILYNL